jgi:hypothetical protein
MRLECTQRVFFGLQGLSCTYGSLGLRRGWLQDL